MVTWGWEKKNDKGAGGKFGGLWLMSLTYQDDDFIL